MSRKPYPCLLGFSGYCIQRGNNPEPIQARKVQSAFPPWINVTVGRVARTQVFAQLAVYYAIDVYTPMAHNVYSNSDQKDLTKDQLKVLRQLVERW